MPSRRNDYDITNRIQTTDPLAVEAEISRLFRVNYPSVECAAMTRAFKDAAALYAGEYPGYRACDTTYHNLQHVMDVTLAMARLMDGYERARAQTPALGEKLFQFGVVVALFHDMGYLRKQDDEIAPNGAFYTREHVARGALFLRGYLTEIGLSDLAEAGAEIIHFTGYEQRVADILIEDPLLRLLGRHPGADGGPLLFGKVSGSVVSRVRCGRHRRRERSQRQNASRLLFGRRSGPENAGIF